MAGAAAVPSPGSRCASLLAMEEDSPIEKQVKELEHQIAHLQRSNAEMEEFLRENTDAELRAAIGENIVTIARRRAIVEDLRKLLPERSGATVVAPSGAAVLSDVDGSMLL